MTLMLLVAHFLALGVAVMVFGWMIFLQRRNRAADNINHSAGEFSPPHAAAMRPSTWLAVRSLGPEAVRAVLADKDEFFISPRVNGWVIVTGLALPHPSEDVDECFIFLSTLSRKLGHVQFFYADRFSRHHAWARLDDGCVTRAYAWAGMTVWNQGIETLPEIEIGVKTFGYGDRTATLLDVETSFENVPRLAARWSLDPAEVKLNSIRQSIGIAGESAWI